MDGTDKTIDGHRNLMKITAKYSLFLFILIASSCIDKTPDADCTPVAWEFCVTKAGEGTGNDTDKVATYRTSLLSGYALSSEGTYSGYYNDKGWLYPCKTDDDGYALDKATGDRLEWTDPDWFSKTDTDSQYGLRAASNTSYSLLVTSPAVKLQPYIKTIDGSPATVYGMPITRESDWAISDPISVYAGGSYLGTYIYNVAGTDNTRTLKERRARINVKVACGAVSSVQIHSVYFKKVMTSAMYNPFSHEYEDNIILDGGKADPLECFTSNSFPANDGDKTGEGEALVVPQGEKIVLTRKDGMQENPEEWWEVFGEDDEWTKGSEDKHVLTAIRDFYILPLDYSLRDNTDYHYADIMPEVTVRIGETGKIKATIQLAAKMEPMIEYTVFIYVSSTYVSANLTVTDWNVHRHWTDDPAEDTDELEIEFGKPAILKGDISVTGWTNKEDETTVQNQ